MVMTLGGKVLQLQERFQQELGGTSQENWGRVLHRVSPGPRGRLDPF